MFGNAHACIAHFEQRVSVRPLQAHCHPAGQRELECVGKEVQNDLFPHLPVDVDPLVELFAIHAEGETRFFHRRPKRAGEIPCQRCQVGLFVRGLRPARLDPREIQEPVDEFVQTRCIALRELQAFPRVLWKAGICYCLLQGPEQQRQWRAELVTDVREKRGLRAVDLRQRLGAAALFFVGARISDGGRDLRGDQFIEAAIQLIQVQPGAHPGYQHSRWGLQVSRPDRHQNCRMWRIRPRP